jgi:alkylated DNA repair dioxygenase AlkB
MCSEYVPVVFGDFCSLLTGSLTYYDAEKPGYLNIARLLRPLFRVLSQFEHLVEREHSQKTIPKKSNTMTAASVQTSPQHLRSLLHQDLDAALPALQTESPSRPWVEILEPGLVVIRNLVDDQGCQRLANEALKMGEQGENGFYSSSAENRVSTTKKVLNTGEKGRGRIYDAVTRFPSFITQHCNRAVSMACKSDEAMPGMDCTHVLLNMYTNRDGLCWHRDIYENDGTSDHPVVNLCVGATCVFGYKHNDDDPDQSVRLRSGDCLLFGGRCRLVKHAILDIDLDDCPEWMAHNPVRFSFTFRDSPEVLGREEEFKYFKVAKDLVGQEDFDGTQYARARCIVLSQSTQKEVITAAA